MIFEGDGFNTIEDVQKEFEISEDDFKDVEILYANYSYGDYEGAAFVVFHKNGKLYEVNASHCSCYGLEGQWDPEETTKEHLMRDDLPYLCDFQLGETYKAVIEAL